MLSGSVARFLTQPSRGGKSRARATLDPSIRAAVCQGHGRRGARRARLAVLSHAGRGHTGHGAGCARLAGGASREIWLFEATFGGAAARQLVLRRDPGPTSVACRSRTRVPRACAPRTPPACRCRPCTGSARIPSRSARRFFIMEYVAGETLARRLLRDAAYERARHAITAQLGAILARHPCGRRRRRGAWRSCRRRPRDGVPPRTRSSAMSSSIGASRPSPIRSSSSALRWLAMRAPAAARHTLVHGDYRIGNVLFGPRGGAGRPRLGACAPGDPMEDLRVDVRQVMAVRRSSFRSGASGARGAVCRLRGGRGRRGRPRGRAFLGGLRQHEVGGDLHRPGPDVPRRWGPQSSSSRAWDAGPPRWSTTCCS